MADTEDKMEDVDVEKEEVEGEPAPAATESKTGGVEEAVANMVKLDGHELPVAGMFVSAAILLTAVTADGGADKDDWHWAYGIALTVITMFFSLVLGAFIRKPELVESQPMVPHHLNHFLFVWNFVGACLMTFGEGPFLWTSNGYFAAWGMAIFSVMGLGMSSDSVKNAGSMMGHLATSIIVIIALSTHDNSFDNYAGESIYGIIMACLSAVTVMYQVSMERKGQEGLSAKVKFPIFALYALCWVVSASLMTFRGPFVLTGNGYFGAWGGAVTGIYCAMAAKEQWE